MKQLRQSTLETLRLGTVLEIFKNGKLPLSADEAVESQFGPADNRGSLVISGVNGIVGSGKAMQLSSRLVSHGVPIIGLDFPGSPDGLTRHYRGLIAAFGKSGADEVMTNIIRLTYDGSSLPSELTHFNPRFLLEAIPEILEVKQSHYALFRKTFPDIDIHSVTSGFPAHELGVSVAHPAFPHEINKVWEMVGPDSIPAARLFWSLGLIPMPVSDDWSFLLDVLFCGLTLAGANIHEDTNLPYWKIDKFVRKHIGPNPFRAHDVIGSRGASFLTWSCLHHLSEHYGDLFQPSDGLTSRKDSGLSWYPPDHFRPVVNWTLDSEEEDEFLTRVLGPLFQMTTILLKEERGHLSFINSIGELCAQFRHGILSMMRRVGSIEIIRRVEAWQKLNPQAAYSDWHPDSLAVLETPAGKQLYVNAEHDGRIGVITLGRESYNSVVDEELNRAIDWLKTEGIDRVILTGDFHLATQMVGADISEFFPALIDREIGYRISLEWSNTARRLHSEFVVSVGFINGKRCLGGGLELLSHCHYLVSVGEASLGMPEVTLPVIPGMEGCHWPLRKAKPEDRAKILTLLLDGKSIQADQTVGWLVDAAGDLKTMLGLTWEIVNSAKGTPVRRKLDDGSLGALPDLHDLRPAENPLMEEARKAILDTVKASCEVPLNEALEIQSRHSAGFMVSKTCGSGFLGREKSRTHDV